MWSPLLQQTSAHCKNICEGKSIRAFGNFIDSIICWASSKITCALMRLTKHCLEHWEGKMACQSFVLSQKPTGLTSTRKLFAFAVKNWLKQPLATLFRTASEHESLLRLYFWNALRPGLLFICNCVGNGKDNQQDQACSCDLFNVMFPCIATCPRGIFIGSMRL